MNSLARINNTEHEQLWNFCFFNIFKINVSLTSIKTYIQCYISENRTGYFIHLEKNYSQDIYKALFSLQNNHPHIV